jgi:hypothetical protein
MQAHSIARYHPRKVDSDDATSFRLDLHSALRADNVTIGIRASTATDIRVIA